MPDLLTFVETDVFTKRISALGLDGSLRGLQLALLADPEAGDVEPGTGGLRKVRFADPTRGKGKRGGVRVEYADATAEEATARRRRRNQAER
jgi:hypothetical protein